MIDDVFFNIDLTQLVNTILSIVDYILDLLNNIVFDYHKGNIDIQFSFWTFLVVVFVLDVVAACLMGAESGRSYDN